MRESAGRFKQPTPSLNRNVVHAVAACVSPGAVWKLISSAPEVCRIARAPSTSSAVPCAISRNFPALIEVSYFKTLSLGMPKLNRPAPKALKPPMRIAPPARRQPKSRSHSDDWTDARYKQDCRAKQQAPQSAPKCSQLSPMLHPVAGMVEANYVFSRVIISTNNREFFQIESCLLQFLDSVPRGGVLTENRDSTQVQY